MPRRVDWVHMPVPRGRSDEAYFAPLDGLKLQPETELVHRPRLCSPSGSSSGSPALRACLCVAASVVVGRQPQQPADRRDPGWDARDG
ncbi:MAG: hypothetical protein ACREVR_13175 [Burkholderiales bacterium]